MSVVRGSLFVVALLATACVRHSISDEENLTPGQWDSMTTDFEPCLGAPPFVPVEQKLIEWSLRQPEATLRLPDDYREAKSAKRGQRVWQGADSTRLEYNITRTVPGGLASSGQIVLENRCFLSVAGHRAMTYRLREDRAQGSLYLAHAVVMLRENVALEVMIVSPSALRREQLLHAISGLMLH